MIYQDGISFVEDADSVDLFSYGTAEDYMAIQSMAGHGKDHEFQAFNLGRSITYGIRALLTCTSI